MDVQYGAELPTRARRVVKSGQILVASVEGSMQSCALITDEYDGALCSTGFYVLDSDKMNAIDAGCNAFLTKPLKKSELLEIFTTKW